MNNRELHYFVTLIRTKSFTRASEVLYVTQPTISKAVKSLETQCNEKLLHRQGRNIGLTAAGEVVFRYGEMMILQMQQMKAELNDLSQLGHGEVKVGIPPMVGHLYAQLLAEFRLAHPNIDLVTFEHGSHKNELALLNGELDLAITMLPLKSEKLSYKKIDDYSVWAVLPKQSRWQSIQTLQVSALKDEMFYLYNTDFALSDRVEGVCQDAGFYPKVGMRSSQWDFIAAMVKSGLGVSFIPEPICKKLDGDEYIFRQTQPEIRWQLAMAYSKERYLSNAAEALFKLFTQPK
ncbi:LysR family transcriptional regulator [Psychromonas sp. RZ22]|uniref:LysR family transcriptional regulator n=1 Tax=Psychromonas algarum TaxID=2555643 RepID=UPI001067C268|nr:LysR family transcriptional regulator [Psychromonas sp. RZ22]TEW54562.1 LysR family transcriptional regulator [Psychromonas sp. RZ22]